MNSKQEAGKIDRGVFESVIRNQCGAVRTEVLTPAGFGVDVSVTDLPGGMALAATSDPLSLIPSLGMAESAWLSVHLLANDMATTGHAPQFAQFVLNLPATLSTEDFSRYWHHIHQYCAAIGTSITGGHTGFVEGSASTIAGGGTFFTVAPRASILTARGARPGNMVLVTKQAAISSAAILALSFPETVQERLGRQTQQDAAALFYETSSLPDALAATDGRKESGVTALHDVTEGGVLGAIYEMAHASGTGVLVHSQQLPAGDAVQRVCSLFDLDPRYCVGAGSMIITCEPDKAAAICERLGERGIACTPVGTITEPSEGIRLEENGQVTNMPYYETDPYWNAFYKALKNGWT